MGLRLSRTHSLHRDCVRPSPSRDADKAAQFVVDDAGLAGFIGEHSHCDGMPTAAMVDWVAKHLVPLVARPAVERPTWQGGADLVRSLQASVPPDNRLIPGDLCGAVRGAGPHETVVELSWSVPLSALAWLGVARAEVSALAAGHRLVTVRAAYGRNRVSKRFKFSPDAWAQVRMGALAAVRRLDSHAICASVTPRQMAMQLAMYRWKGGAAATYEPAHTVGPHGVHPHCVCRVD